MKKNNYICALDIGASKVAACVAQIKNNRILDIFFHAQPGRGVKKGAIVNSIELVGLVSNVLKDLKVKTGGNLKFIYTNISGPDIVTKHSRAIMPLAERGNKVITQSDIMRVQEQARILGSSLEEDIIHQIPSSFTIDSRNNILNPLGLYSHKLEVDLHLVCGKVSSIQSLSRVISQSGGEIRGLFFSGLATADVVFNQNRSKGINVLCDIGSDLTELVVFQNGLLKEIRILPCGGDDLTAQLASELKIPWDLAEEVKISHGSVGEPGHIKEDKEVLLKQNSRYKPIKQKVIAQVLTAKANGLANSIKEALVKIVPLNQVDEFATCGRAVLLDGFLEILENNLEVPVKLGRINHPDMLPLMNKIVTSTGPKYLACLTSLGIICQALRKERPQAITGSYVPPNVFSMAMNKVKEVYQEYF